MTLAAPALPRHCLFYLHSRCPLPTSWEDRIGTFKFTAAEEEPEGGREMGSASDRLRCEASLAWA